MVWRHSNNELMLGIPDEELFSETYVGCTASYFVLIIGCSRWFCNPPPLFSCSVLLYLRSPKSGCCSIFDDLSCSLFSIKVCTNEGPVGGMWPSYLLSMLIQTPRHRNAKICLRSMTMTRTSLEKIAIHSMKITKNQAILWQRKKRNAWRKKPQAPKMMQIPKPYSGLRAPGNSHYPNKINSTTTLRIASQRLASPPKEE